VRAFFTELVAITGGEIEPEPPPSRNGSGSRAAG
jgi:hypothetical protein